MPELKIKVRKNGPYLVDASQCPVELVDADGNKYDLTGKPAFSLCRCGASANRPFCDGSHKRIEFQAPDSAIQPQEPALKAVEPAIKTSEQPG